MDSPSREATGFVASIVGLVAEAIALILFGRWLWDYIQPLDRQRAAVAALIVGGIVLVMVATMLLILFIAKSMQAGSTLERVEDLESELDEIRKTPDVLPHEQDLLNFLFRDDVATWFDFCARGPEAGNFRFPKTLVDFGDMVSEILDDGRNRFRMAAVDEALDGLRHSMHDVRLKLTSGLFPDDQRDGEDSSERYFITSYRSLKQSDRPFESARYDAVYTEAVQIDDALRSAADAHRAFLLIAIKAGLGPTKGPTSLVAEDESVEESTNAVGHVGEPADLADLRSVAGGLAQELQTFLGDRKRGESGMGHSWVADEASRQFEWARSVEATIGFSQETMALYADRFSVAVISTANRLDRSRLIDREELRVMERPVNPLGIQEIARILAKASS